MNKPAIPSDFDEYALDMARRVASIDRARLPGSTAQFVAVIQSTIVDAMLFASAYAREPHVTVKGNSIVMSPAMPMADHEMDVLRSIASRLKSNDLNPDGGPYRPSQLYSHTHHGHVWIEPVDEETKPC